MSKRLNLYEIMDIIEYANNGAGDALFKMLDGEEVDKN